MYIHKYLGNSFCSICLATHSDLEVKDGKFEQRIYDVRNRKVYEESYDKFRIKGKKNKKKAKVFMYICTHICMYLHTHK